MIVLAVSLALAGVVMIAGGVLSWTMTRRQALSEIQTPNGFGLAYEQVQFPATDGLLLCG